MALLEIELDLIQSHMTQKPVLRGEVDARALRVYIGSRMGGSGKRGKCNALGCWRSKIPRVNRYMACRLREAASEPSFSYPEHSTTRTAAAQATEPPGNLRS